MVMWWDGQSRRLGDGSLSADEAFTDDIWSRDKDGEPFLPKGSVINAGEEGLKPDRRVSPKRSMDEYMTNLGHSEYVLKRRGATPILFEWLFDIDPPEYERPSVYSVHGDVMGKYGYLSRLNEHSFSNSAAGGEYHEYEKSKQRRESIKRLVEHFANVLGLPEYIAVDAWQRLSRLDTLRMGGLSYEAKALGAITFAANQDSRRLRRLVRQEDQYKELRDDTNVSADDIKRVWSHLRDNDCFDSPPSSATA